MDPRDFLALAKDLRKRGDAAALRTAISRAYYYAFVLSRKYVGKYHPIPSSVDAHKFLPELLQNSGNDDLRDVGKHLDDLRRDRNEADYDVDVDRPEKTKHVDYCLKMAEQIVLDLVAVMGDHVAWNKAVAEMARWKSLVGK